MMEEKWRLAFSEKEYSKYYYSSFLLQDFGLRDDSVYDLSSVAARVFASAGLLLGSTKGIHNTVLT